MAVVAESIDISRSPDDVFWYATDFAEFPGWQGNVVSARRDGESALVTGSRAVVTRRVGPRRVRATETITELTPPKTWQVRSSGGLPVTAIANGRVEPLDGGSRSRVTITLGFEGHGIGKVLIALVIRRQARRQLPQNAAKLKEVLERGGLAPARALAVAVAQTAALGSPARVAGLGDRAEPPGQTPAGGM